MEPAYFYKAITEDVHDGDTYHLRIDLGFRVAISIAGRLRAVNCPELNTPEGKVARDYVKQLLITPVGPTPLVVSSYKDEQSFARWVVNVWLPGDENLGDLLVEAGHAVRLDIP
jgi:endonuclease YncB( thermonuclease family)